MPVTVTVQCKVRVVCRLMTYMCVCFVCVCQDELMAELEELEQEELDKDLLGIEGAEDVPLPSVPSTSLPSRPGITPHLITHTHLNASPTSAG